MKEKQSKIYCCRCNQYKVSSKFDLDGLLESKCNDCKDKKLTKKQKKDDNPGIYKIKNKVTGKVYIGQTSHLQKRKANYFGKLPGYINKELKEDMKLYGKDKFSFTVLKVMPNSSQQDRLYMEMIFKQKEKAELYNVLEGIESKQAYQQWREEQLNDTKLQS